MIRAWLGIALLAVSWLLGLQYYHQTDWLPGVMAKAFGAVAGVEIAVQTATAFICILLVVLAILLLLPPSASAVGVRREGVGQGTLLIALALLLPPLALVPWPYRAAPLLMAFGVALHLLAVPRAWGRRLGAATLTAGVVLLAQALALLAYASVTARSHELPWPLPSLLAGILRLLGADVARDGSSLTVWGMRQVNPFGATWELLVDPPSLCFLVGAAILLALRAGSAVLPGRRLAALWRPVAALALCAAAWLPIRAGLLIALYLHRLLRTEYEAHLELMNQFWCPWIHLLLLVPLVLLAWRFVDWRLTGGPSPAAPEEPAEALPPRIGSRKSSMAASAALVGLAVAAFSAALLYDPIGVRKNGRVFMDEHHSTWEPTQKPFDTEWYGHEAAYTYACIYDYLTRFYDMSRLTNPIDDLEALVQKIRSQRPIIPIDDHGLESLDALVQKLRSRIQTIECLDALDQMARSLRLTTTLDHQTLDDLDALLQKIRGQGILAAIDDHTLDDCDVLIVKIPTERYTHSEVAAIVRFVERGGGVLFIGEHTDVFHSDTSLNDITRHFGFSFRFDCLFGIDTIFDDLFLPPPVPHPMLQYLPPYDRRAPCFDFAVSCSIAPGASAGRAAGLDWGLNELGCDYHASNYYPQVENRPDMRYGAFIQFWTARYGAGRVLGHADSTQFSNFCTFEPGKAELMLGMVEWLNHRNRFNHWPTVFFLLGLALLAGGLFLARGWRGAWLPLIAAGLSGWTLAGIGIREAHRAAMPLPKPIRPYVNVVIDRTVCSAPLTKSGFIAGKPETFCIFERWILRLGYFTTRRVGLTEESSGGPLDHWTRRLREAISGRHFPDLFGGDVLLFMHPDQNVAPEFCTHLADYVRAGGKVLVLDSPENAKSTADSLIWPFGLNVHHETRQAGVLAPPRGWPAVPVPSACEVTGGTPLFQVNGRPVGAWARYGEGQVTVLGFASRFTDANMGVTGDALPDADLRKIYDLEYALIRAVVDGTLP